MIDTLRMSGPRLDNEFKPETIKFFSTKTNGKLIERAELSALQKGKNWRIWYDGGADRYHVEFNIAKILYNYNIYNYENDTNILDQITFSFARAFFGSLNDVFISRADIGAVSDLGDFENCRRNLEQFRQVKPDGVRYAKQKNQAFETSVFYSQKDYSIKIYCKGPEMVHINSQRKQEKIPDDILEYSQKLLRFEKTYRAAELAKVINVAKVPFLGIPILQFKTAPLVNDFYKVFLGWDRIRVPPVETTKRGLMGLLETLELSGQFSSVASSGVVSRATISRYKKLKKSEVYISEINFQKNLPKNLQNVLTNTLTLSPKHFVL